MLVGARMVNDTDEGNVIAFEYRVGSNGKAALTVGNPTEIVSSITLGYADNAIIRDFGKKYGVRSPEFAIGAEKEYTPSDGVVFVFAMLVQFWRNNGYSWMEPILA